MKKRLDYIDMVKGIGILGIVVMHAGVVPERAVAWLSSFVTPLFFLVAGMLIGCTGERERAGKEVVLRKGRALLVPFWCFSLLYILRDVARMAAGVSSMEELKMEGVAMVTLWGTSVLWFLPALFLSEVLFVFLLKILGTVRACVIAPFLTIVSFVCNGMLVEREVFFQSGMPAYAVFCAARTILRSVYALPYVCAGYVLFQGGRNIWERERQFSLWQTAGGIMLFVLGILIHMINGIFDFRTLSFGDMPVLAYLSASLSFLGVTLVCRNCKPVKPLLYFGKNSLIIMATHIDFYFLYLALNVAYRVDHWIPRWNRAFFFVNVVGMILILEVACIELINRYLPFLTGKRKDSHSRKNLL